MARARSLRWLSPRTSATATSIPSTRPTGSRLSTAKTYCGTTLTCRSKPVTRLPSDPGVHVMGILLETMAADPAAGTESILAEMLAEVMRAERVPVDGHFFDDLGADSLVMAKFCARVRKREDLPSVSMKDIYAHPTIRSLAESFGLAEVEAEVDLDAIATLIRPRDPMLVRPAAPASTRQYLMCGALQLLFFLGYAWVAAIVGARAYEWISAAKGGYEEIYLRSVAFGGAGFIVLCTVPILAKWVLIGRW